MIDFLEIDEKKKKIKTLDLNKEINLLIIGIHLVACPIPQLSGATRIFFFKLIL